MVTLVVPGQNISEEFSVAHAERLLDMATRTKSGWELPEDSKYYYDEENGLRLKSDTTNS